MAVPPVTLSPYTVDLLPAVQPWFDDPETVRWLGGPDWPAREFRVPDTGIGEMHRGRRVLRTHSWVARDAAGRVVAQVGGDVYDRWLRPGDGPSFGMAYVVDPRRRRQGFGTATLLAVVRAPEVADVVLFAAGIEPANVASARCAAAAGFTPDSGVPDDEGIVHHVLRVGPRPAGPSRPPRPAPGGRGASGSSPTGAPAPAGGAGPATARPDRPAAGTAR